MLLSLSLHFRYIHFLVSLTESGFLSIYTPKFQYKRLWTIFTALGCLIATDLICLFFEGTLMMMTVIIISSNNYIINDNNQN